MPVLAITMALLLGILVDKLATATISEHHLWHILKLESYAIIGLVTAEGRTRTGIRIVPIVQSASISISKTVAM